MPNRRSLIPPRGNPARAPFFICVVGFTAMAIFFNVVIPLMGLGTEGNLFINLVLFSIAAVFLWVFWNQGQTSEKDRARLVAGERWAHWQLSPFEYKLYARRENNWARGLAVAFFLGGVVVGLVTYAVTGDLVRSALFGGIFLIATHATLTNDNAPGPSSRDQTLDVFIGPQGALIGGRYLPFNAPGMSLQSIEIEYEEWALPVLVFRLRTRAGHRTIYDHVSVPVPVDRIDEARTIVKRFNEGTLPSRASLEKRLPHPQVALR